MHQPTPQTPSWSNDLRTAMASGWGKHLDREEELSVEPREEFELQHTDVTVVFKDDGDIIFQFFPQGSKWPVPAAARDFLAEAIEAHFGSTDRFAASYVPELESWAVKAAGLTTQVSYDKAFHVDRFVHLVDDAVDAL